jgi:hypothetical protein
MIEHSGPCKLPLLESPQSGTSLQRRDRAMLRTLTVWPASTPPTFSTAKSRASCRYSRPRKGRMGRATECGASRIVQRPWIALRQARIAAISSDSNTNSVRHTPEDRVVSAAQLNPKVPNQRISSPGSSSGRGIFLPVGRFRERAPRRRLPQIRTAVL